MPASMAVAKPRIAPKPAKPGERIALAIDERIAGDEGQRSTRPAGRPTTNLRASRGRTPPRAASDRAAPGTRNRPASAPSSGGGTDSRRKARSAGWRRARRAMPRRKRNRAAARKRTADAETILHCGPCIDPARSVGAPAQALLAAAALRAVWRGAGFSRSAETARRRDQRAVTMPAGAAAAPAAASPGGGHRQIVRRRRRRLFRRQFQIEDAHVVARARHRPAARRGNRLPSAAHRSDRQARRAAIRHRRK